MIIRNDIRKFPSFYRFMKSMLAVVSQSSTFLKSVLHTKKHFMPVKLERHFILRTVSYILKISFSTVFFSLQRSELL